MISPLVDLERHAAERPDHPAIATPQRSYSFAEVRELVGAVAGRLRAAGIVPRSLVGVDLPAHLEWIVDLALMRLAARSASLRGVADPSALSPHALVVALDSRLPRTPTTVEVDEFWVLGSLRDEADAPLFDYPRPDSVFRVMLTSGTTGTARAAAYTVGAFERRRAGLAAYWTDARPELDLMPLSTTGGFHTAVAALRHGEAFRAVDAITAETMGFAAEQGIEVLCGSPQHLATAIGVLESHAIELPSLTEVRMAGAAPGAVLLRRVRELLGVPIRLVYGSTEGGGVTSRLLDDDDTANVGPVLDGLELQVVDDADAPVGAGVEGRVRYRGPGMTAGYLVGGDVQPFPGGWFEPGDVGSLNPDGSLRLGGRESELLNVGGLKVDPARVDAAALEFPGVRDCAAFAFERQNGSQQLVLAVVSDPDCDLRRLDQVLRSSLPRQHPTGFWRIAEIPRNRMGKPERVALAAAYARVAPR